MGRAKLAALALVGLVLVLGCSRPSELHPVEGTVSWRGKPTPGARVIFHPVSATPNLPQPSALVDDNGSFRVGTRGPGDGARPGEYKVTIEWLDLSPQAETAELGDNVPTPTDKLAGRYADPNRSAFRVTIKEGKNVLPPFELK